MTVAVGRLHITVALSPPESAEAPQHIETRAERAFRANHFRTQREREIDRTRYLTGYQRWR